MAYTPTEWKKGDVVTSEKLNKLEGGVAGAGGGILFVDMTIDQNDDRILSETFGTIKEAFVSGKQIWIRQYDEGNAYTYYSVPNVEIADSLDGGGGIQVNGWENWLYASDDAAYPADSGDGDGGDAI